MPIPDPIPFGLLAATVLLPNFIVGVVLLTFRPRVVAFVARIVPAMTDEGRLYLSRFILVGGIFMLAITTGLLVLHLFEPAG